MAILIVTESAESGYAIGYSLFSKIAKSFAVLEIVWILKSDFECGLRKKIMMNY